VDFSALILKFGAMKVVYGWIVLAVLLLSKSAAAQEPAVFRVIPLGIKGGLAENNLSAYLAAPAGSDSFLALDAGTIYSGVETAIRNGVFSGKPQDVIRRNIKGYFLSHAHLDHVAGLLLNAPDDTAKNIYALPGVTDIVRDNYFNWSNWANFTDEGDLPRLNKYHYVRVKTGEQFRIEHTALEAEVFELSHVAPYRSSAILLKSGPAYLAYLGDTGADSLERSAKLAELWSRLAPLASAKALKALFIEVSYPNEQPDNLLFGHLTPRLLFAELAKLAALTGGKLTSLTVVITHMKPSGNNEAIIRKQLEAANTIGVKLLYPEQGKEMKF
jgi:cAMP phosphodiesterase